MANARRIKLDNSTTSTVVTCSDCPGIWWAFAWTKEAAYRSGAAHEVTVHGVEPERAANAGKKHARRKTAL